MDIHKEIDTRGLNCPLPILKAKKALADMVSGQLLKVVSTDNGSLRDFQAFAKQTGNEPGRAADGGRRIHPPAAPALSASRAAFPFQPLQSAPHRFDTAMTGPISVWATVQGRAGPCAFFRSPRS